MFKFQKAALTALTVLASMANADLTYLDGPTEEWSAIVNPLDEGNAVKISPDGQVLYVTSSDGAITGIDPESGTSLFSYKPPGQGAAITSTSGVSFYEGANASVVYYAVRDGANGASTTPMSRVIALSHPSGESLWVSSAIDGEATGTPLVSSDGRHVFVVSNSNSGSVGHFTVLETAFNGTILHTEFNETNPFSPPAIFHSPAEGYYNGGEYNERDIVAWSFARDPADLGVGEGGTFAFQLPRFYIKGDPVAVQYLRQVGWQSFAAPLITNSGRSIYYAVSRNQLRAWVGEEGLGAAKFDKGASRSLNLPRGNPTYLAPFSSPVANSDDSIIFCGLANNSMAALSNELDLLWVANTWSNTAVESEAVVSMDDKVVFWSESAGFINAYATSGAEMWRVQLTADMNSEFSISNDGTTLYLGDKGGRVVAWTVADPPTPAPSDVPSEVPSMTPSQAPTGSPTITASPTFPLPTSLPSAAPSPAPSQKPVTEKPTSPASNPNVRVAPSSSASMMLLGLSSTFAWLVFAVALF